VKPLELTVWARNENYPGASNVVYEHPDGLVAVGDLFVDAEAHEKRLTDAELAAEHHRAKWTGLMHEHKWHSILSDKHRAMIATVERFATLPHYDEPDHG
jgi:hypothetical protein